MLPVYFLPGCNKWNRLVAVLTSERKSKAHYLQIFKHWKLEHCPDSLLGQWLIYGSEVKKAKQALVLTCTVVCYRLNWISSSCLRSRKVKIFRALACLYIHGYVQGIGWARHDYGQQISYSTVWNTSSGYNALGKLHFSFKNLLPSSRTNQDTATSDGRHKLANERRCLSLGLIQCSSKHTQWQ